MDDKKGYILLHRKLLGSAIWCDPHDRFCRKAAWIDILLLAYWKDDDLIIGGKSETIRRGEFYTSYNKLAKRWHWDKKTVSRYILELKRAGMVDTRCISYGTVLTVVNYEKYQVSGDDTLDQSTDQSTDLSLESSLGTNEEIYNKYRKKGKKESAAAQSPINEPRLINGRIPE